MRPLKSIPTWLCTIAMVFALGYLIVHLLGWREMTTVLSGTYPSGDRGQDEFRAACYLAFYFGFVVAAPILVLAAGAFALVERQLLPRSRVTD